MKDLKLEQSDQGMEQPPSQTKTAQPDAGMGKNMEEESAYKDNERPKDHELDRDGDRTPRLGMTFKSYIDVCKFYKQYACDLGFGVSVKNSWFTEDGRCRGLVVKCCKGGRSEGNVSRPNMRTDCQAMIKVNLWDDGLLHVSKIVLEHNHELGFSDSKVYFFRCNKILPLALKKRFALGGEAQLEHSYDGNVAGSDGGNYVYRMKRLKLGEGDVNSLHQFFASMQSKNPNFFYLMDLNEEGCLRNVFWADARSRAAYSYFGDVVYFDTTCLTNNYDLPFVSFLGVNNHGQQILLGCGLLSDPTTEAYIWLFEAFLSCISRRQPNAIITDHCKAIQVAVAHVLPQARHRMCLWHAMKMIQQLLDSSSEQKEIVQQLKKIVFYSLRIEEFEEQWKQVIEKFRLVENNQLDALYANRQLWVPAFLKDTFWAGMSITQHGDDVKFFFEGFIHPTTSLKQFVTYYETALQSKYEMEAIADFESFNKKQPLVSKFYMEEKLSNFYSLHIFKKFQDEVQGVMYCNVSLVKRDGPASTFIVKQCTFAEDGKTMMGYRDYEVFYNVDGPQVQCICQYFQFEGVLCRHAIAVLCSQQVNEIPRRYTLDRWRIDFKKFKTASGSSSDVVLNNEMERYDYLTKRCLRAIELGSVSDKKFQLAVKLAGQMEELLSTCEDEQMQLVCDGTDGMENGHLKRTMASENKSNRNVLDPVQARQTSRPSQKRKDSHSEKIVQSRKKMSYLVPPIYVNEDKTFSTAATISHGDGHSEVQKNMEELYSTDLSLSSHVEVPPNV